MAQIWRRAMEYSFPCQRHGIVKSPFSIRLYLCLARENKSDEKKSNVYETFHFASLQPELHRWSIQSI